MASPTPRILLAGLPASLASWLAQRLDAVVEVAFDGDEALDSARAGRWALLLVDSRIPGLSVDTLVQRLRERTDTAAIPVILATEPPDASAPDRLERMVRQHGVERVLMHPIDRGELARHASDLMHRPLVEQAGPRAPGLSPMLDAIWNRSLPQIHERVAAVRDAIEAARAGTLDDRARRHAASEAHKLTGLLGTLGVSEGSRLAREAEQALESGAEQTAALGPLADTLEAQVAARGAGAAAPGGSPDAGGALLVVGGDPAWARALDHAAAGRGVRILWTPRAADAAEHGTPAAVLVDLEDGGGGDDLVAELATRLPGTPLAVMAGRDSLLDRVRALQLGARTFLQKPVDPAAALEVLMRAASRGAAAARVLAVDDDPGILESLESLLKGDGVEVHGETEPLRFWSTLQRVQPELLVLDVDMPYLNGIELCRVLRADPRWGKLPVVFLTARADRDTLLRVFAAGADDYLTKPFVGPELSVRIRARLERARNA